MWFFLLEKYCWRCNLVKEATSETGSYKVKFEPYVDRMNFTFFSVSNFFCKRFVFCQQKEKNEYVKVLVMLIWLGQVIPIVNLL